MRYLFDEGLITLRRNVLTWSLERLDIILPTVICEIRTTEFLFCGCRYTLAILPNGQKGCEDFFGVRLYSSKGDMRPCDFVEFSMEDKYGNKHSSRIERSEFGLYRNDKFILLSEFIDCMPLGRLTMVCKMFSYGNPEFTSATDDESIRDINDSGEFVYISSLKKSVTCPNGDYYNCPSLSATISSMKLSVPQESLCASDFILGFPPAVSALSCPSHLSKQGKFAKKGDFIHPLVPYPFTCSSDLPRDDKSDEKSAKIESDFGTDTAGENLESKPNYKRNKKKTHYNNKMSKKEVRHSRSQSDSKILIKDKKVPGGYLLKTNENHISCYKTQNDSLCSKQNNVEVPEDDIEICKEVVDDNLVEASGFESSCKSDPISPCYMQKNIEVLQPEDDTKNTSENLASDHKTAQSLKMPCTDENFLEDIAEPDGCRASYEDPEVDIKVCDISSNINTFRVKKEVCSACFNSNPQKPAECDKNNAEDKHFSSVPLVNEIPHATEIQPSVKLQNNPKLIDNVEIDIEEADATNRNKVILIKSDESPNMNISSTDTEKVAAKECKLRAATVDATNNDLENRSSLDALRNLELKMAKIHSEMKKLEKLSDDYKNLYLEGKDSDMTIEMGDRAFKVHKIILMRRSAAFEKLLSDKTCEFSNNTICIDINGCDSRVFHIFLLYLYSAKCESISNANVFGLYCSANEFDVPELKEECIQFMKNSLDLQSICDVISLAKKYNEAELMEVATGFFAKNVKKIRETDKWKLFRREDPDTAEELFVRSLEILEKNIK